MTKKTIKISKKTLNQMQLNLKVARTIYAPNGHRVILRDFYTDKFGMRYLVTAGDDEYGFVYKDEISGLWVSEREDELVCRTGQHSQYAATVWIVYPT